MSSPSPSEVEQAMAEARRILKREAPFSRVELVAFIALGEVFPETPRAEIATRIGLDGDWDHAAAIAAAQHAPWWREDLVNHVVGALVAPSYGEQAK